MLPRTASSSGSVDTTDNLVLSSSSSSPDSALIIVTEGLLLRAAGLEAEAAELGVPFVFFVLLGLRILLAFLFNLTTAELAFFAVDASVLLLDLVEPESFGFGFDVDLSFPFMFLAISSAFGMGLRVRQ